jgi:hypothetical protein
MRINLFEALLNAHIARIETLVAERDNDSPWDRELNKVDRKNLASLHEGRIPEYGDHMELLGDGSYPMSEFNDLVEEQRLATP